MTYWNLHETQYERKEMAHGKEISNDNVEARSVEQVEYCSCCGEPMSEREAHESGLFQLIEQAMSVAVHLHQLDEAHTEEIEIIFDNLGHARHMVAAHVMGIEECDGEYSAVNP